MRSPFPGMDPYLELRWEGVLRDSGVAVAEPLVFELHEPLITVAP